MFFKGRMRKILLLICSVLVLTSIVLLICLRGKMQGISDTKLSTGAINSCLAYDSESKIIVVGTNSTNELVAYQEGREIWRASAKGAYSNIVINHKRGIVCAGNQDYRVYLYDLKSGEKLREIDTTRRVVAVDFNTAGDRIAVATLTGTSSASAMIFDLDGSELLSLSLKVKVAGILFTGDQSFAIGNNRGELIRFNLSGQELGKYKTNYSVLQMNHTSKGGIAVCKDGSYYLFDQDLNILRSGRIENDIHAVISSVGCDEKNEGIVVGTEEGYIFAQDQSGRQIAELKVEGAVRSFATDGDKVIFTGDEDHIREVELKNLTALELKKSLFIFARIMLAVSLLFMAILMLTMFPQSGKFLKKCCRDIWKARMAYFLLLPGLILIWIFNYQGIFTAFIRSFTNWSSQNSTLAQIQFVGFDNFRRMITEGYFLIGVRNLLILVLTGAIKILTVPLLCAWLCYSASGTKRKYVHRFLFVLPIVVPSVINAMIWLKIYDPNIGLINEFLRTIGLGNLARVWLGDAGTAIWAIVFMGFPFVNAMAFLVYYGGLLAIGHDVEESALVDGANRWNIFCRIQLPLLKPQFRIMLILTLIGTMQNFNEIYVLTQGGPGTSTYVPALELYFNVAQFGRYGYACALGVVLFLMTLTITLINLYFTRERQK